MSHGTGSEHAMMQPRSCARQCRERLSGAFTLLELLVVITIITITAVTILPSLANDDQLRLQAAASIVNSDIEFAQTMTLSFPDEPIVVRFDGEDTYWLARADTPETPLLRADTGEPYLVQLGVGRASGAAGVTFKLHEMSDTLAFNAQGGLDDLSATPVVELAMADRTLSLSIAPTTGTITELESYVPPAKPGSKSLTPPKDGGESPPAAPDPEEEGVGGLLGGLGDLLGELF